jgi:hypothetical protein
LCDGVRLYVNNEHPIWWTRASVCVCVWFTCSLFYALVLVSVACLCACVSL